MKMKYTLTLMLAVMALGLNAQQKSKLDSYSTDYVQTYSQQLRTGFERFHLKKGEANYKNWMLYSTYLDQKCQNQRILAFTTTVLTGVGVSLVGDPDSPEATYMMLALGGSISLTAWLSSLSNRSRSNKARVVALYFN